MVGIFLNSSVVHFCFLAGVLNDAEQCLCSLNTQIIFFSLLVFMDVPLCCVLPLVFSACEILN